MSNQYSGGLITKTPTTPNSISAPGVWTLSQQAAAQATNTWPFPRDPQFKNVTMLLQGNGSAGAASSGAGSSTSVIPFNADASTNNFNVTINGDAKSNNFTPYQGSGYYSNYFNGVVSANQSLTASPTAVGTSNFTVEFWFYYLGVNSDSSDQQIYDTGTNGFSVYISGGSVGVYNRVTSSAIFSTVAITANSWVHIAFVRSGTGASQTVLYINGTSSATATLSTNFTSTTATIGGRFAVSGASWNTVNGYVSNVRYNSTAVYSAAFTPSTTPLTAISGTVLLTCQSNRFIDNSASPLTLTVNGSPQVSPAQPFTLPTTVATYGSGYFDGTGDYLTIADNAVLELSTSSFTMEWWSYPTTFASNQFQLSKCATSASTEGFLTYINTSGVLKFNANSVSAWDIANDQGTLALKLNAWNHCAISRNGSSWRMWVNGVSSVTITSALGVQNTSTAYSIAGAANGSAPFLGYITDTRIVIGSYVYDPASSTITIPTTPLTAVTNTQLLTTQFNGGGNNSGFKDSSQFNFPITRNGNTTQGTFTPYGSNWSNYLNGSSNFTAGTTASNFLCTGSATGITATFEAWVFPTAYSTGGSSYLYSGIHTKGTTYFNFGIRDGAVRFYWYDGAQKYVDSASTSDVPLNTWTHIAVTISGATIKIYINGALSTTSATYTGVQSAGSGNTEYIGKENNGYYVNGYVSNYRLTNTVVYSAAFTPSTTPLTAVTGTQLLTCQSNRFIDNSSNAFTVTAVSAPTVQRFSPFAPLTVYNPTTYGGSAYFDGSGDYLNLASNGAFNIGTNSFCIEFWVYTSSFPSGLTAVGLVSASYNTNVHILGFNTTGIRFYIVNSYVDSTTAINLNAWNHVACVRNGTTATVYINGVASGTGTLSGTGANSALYIGTSSHATGETMTGYLSNVRFVNGSAVYTSNFTPNAPLTAIANTSFLLSGTNPAILDNSMMNDLETVGNAAVSTSVKKYGAASMYFDGTGDALYATSQATTFGTGDFTLEFWVYFNAVNNGVVKYIYDMRNSGSTTASFLAQESSNAWTFWNGAGSVLSTGFTGSTFAATTWTHVAICRSSGTTKFFVNGTQTGSVADTSSYANSTLIVGARYNYANELNAYIDDFRITKYARYTTAFTVPDQAFQLG